MIRMVRVPQYTASLRLVSRVLSLASPGLPEFNAGAMAQLEAMGFPIVRCQKALLATGNSDADAAMEWLFQHMEDPGERSPGGRHTWHICTEGNVIDIDAPIQPSGGKGPEPSAGQISMLADMGFTHAQAKKALRETVRPCVVANNITEHRAYTSYRVVMQSVPWIGCFRTLMT